MPIAGLPKGLRRQVRDSFVAALQTSRLLSNGRFIKTWLTWDGSAAIAEPTVDEYPACMVRMIGGPVKRLATTRAPGQAMTHVDQSNPTMLIDLWTAGTDAGDLFDLADLVYRALSPQDPDERAQLNERFRLAGIKDWQLAREVLPMGPESYTQAGTTGQGSYTLTVQFYS